MTDYVLCQDCNNVEEYTDERHNDEELCPCGGQFCGCPGCNEIAQHLIDTQQDS